MGHGGARSWEDVQAKRIAAGQDRQERLKPAAQRVLSRSPHWPRRQLDLDTNKEYVLGVALLERVVMADFNGQNDAAGGVVGEVKKGLAAGGIRAEPALRYLRGSED